MKRILGGVALGVAAAGFSMGLGCYSTPIDTSEYARGPAPLRMPNPEQHGDGCYEDDLAGGQIFEMYCGSCHNFRPLSERPFSNYQNAFMHMRTRANLTGEEYAKLMAWMKRWYDLPASESHETPSPKRMIFGQPIPEMRQQQAKEGTDLPAGPRPGETNESSPGQPPPGTGPREGR